MKKERKWWKVPVILSAILGFTPAMFIGLNILYAIRFAAYQEALDAYGPGISESLVAKKMQEMVGGLFVLFFILAAIWIPTFIALGIRKLKRKPPNGV